MNVPRINQPSPPAIGPRWSRTGRRRAGLGLLAGVALLAASVAAYHSWAVWPVRIELRAAGDVIPRAFSPDGKVLATSGDGGIILWDVADGRRRATWPSRHGNYFLYGSAFAPDGRTFVARWHLLDARSPTAFDIIDVATGRVRGTVTCADGNCYGMAFDADSRNVRLVVRGPGGIEIVDCDLASGRESSRRTLAMAFASHVMKFSPDGRHLAAVPWGTPPATGSPSDIRLWDVDRDGEVARLPGRPGVKPSGTLEFSPDGSALAVGRDDGSIELWDVGSRRLRTTLRGHAAGFEPHDFGFATDGSALASMGRYRVKSLTMDALRVRIAQLLGDDRWERGPESEVIVLSATNGRRLGIAPSESFPVLSPDGRTLATLWSPDPNAALAGPHAAIVTRLRTIPEGLPEVAPWQAPGE